MANELHLVLGTDGHRVGFNPHSPLLANELHAKGGGEVATTSFNPHSPLLANELRPLARGWPKYKRFQSTFAIAGE